MHNDATLHSSTEPRNAMDLETAQLRQRWSSWSRCESSFAMALVPAQPGVFVVAEEVLAPGEYATLTAKRMLAVFHAAEAGDLGRALSHIFASDSCLRQKLSQARCFVRYAVIPDPAERRTVVASLSQWMASSTETATGLVRELAATATPPPSPIPWNERRCRERQREPKPMPLPAGF